MNTQEPAWIEWTGGDCPVAPGTDCEVRFADGGVARDEKPEGWFWGKFVPAGITHYRVWNAEPTWQAQALSAGWSPPDDLDALAWGVVADFLDACDLQAVADDVRANKPSGYARKAHAVVLAALRRVAK